MGVKLYDVSIDRHLRRDAESELTQEGADFHCAECLEAMQDNEFRQFYYDSMDQRLNEFEGDDA